MTGSGKKGRMSILQRVSQRQAILNVVVEDDRGISERSVKTSREQSWVMDGPYYHGYERWEFDGNEEDQQL